MAGRLLNRAKRAAPTTADSMASRTTTTTTTTTLTTEKSLDEGEACWEHKEARQDIAELSTDASINDDGDLNANVDGTNTAEENASTNDEDESKYPSGTKLALLTFGLCMASLVVSLDNTIIATAIPRITTQFNSLDDVGWYGSAYLLTTTSLQPSFGKVYTYFDVKWVYLSSLVIFELGSIICATSVNSTMLIVGRAVAGAGAAAIFSGAMTIIAFAVPLRKRAVFIAALSSMFGISSVIGPIIGGALTDRASWRWCFWINLPFGGATILTVLVFFSNPPRQFKSLSIKEKLQKIDLIGAFLLICAIVCLLLALQWGGTVFPWSDSRVWGCLLGFGLLILAFTALQAYLGDRATLPPRILCRQRSVAACAAFSAFLACALYTHVYYLPFYFQAVKGVTAEGSGFHCIPYLISNTIASIIVGASITAIGPVNPPMWIGSAIFCVGSGLLFTLKVSSSAGMWIGYQILAGLGAGACVQIPFIAVQLVLSEDDIPVGNAVAIFFSTLGGAVSISIAQNIFSNTLIREVPRLAPQADLQQILKAGATGLRKVVPVDLLPGVLAAYDVAIQRTFILSIVFASLAFCVSFVMEWKSVKGKRLAAAGGA